MERTGRSLLTMQLTEKIPVSITRTGIHPQRGGIDTGAAEAGPHSPGRGRPGRTRSGQGIHGRSRRRQGSLGRRGPGGTVQVSEIHPDCKQPTSIPVSATSPDHYPGNRSSDLFRLGRTVARKFDIKIAGENGGQSTTRKHNREALRVIVSVSCGQAHSRCGHGRTSEHKSEHAVLPIRFSGNQGGPVGNGGARVNGHHARRQIDYGTASQCGGLRIRLRPLRHAVCQQRREQQETQACSQVTCHSRSRTLPVIPLRSFELAVSRIRTLPQAQTG